MSSSEVTTEFARPTAEQVIGCCIQANALIRSDDLRALEIIPLLGIHVPSFL
jgi:hypothetical protein